MPAIHFTVDGAATWAVKRLMDRDTNLTNKKKEDQLKARKYNLLLDCFNASTVMLALAVSSVVLLSFSSAFTFLAFGLFTRYASSKEIEKYFVEPLPKADAASAERRDGLLRRLASLIDSDKQSPEKKSALFQNLGIEEQKGYEADAIIFFDFVIWKNKVEIPE